MSKKSIIIGIIICIGLLVFLLFSKPKLSNQDTQLYNYLFNAVTDNAPQDINSILDNSDEDERLYDLFIYIGDKSNYGQDLSNFNLAEQSFYMLYNFHDEVGCGGTEQFIYNNYYNYEIALEIFKEMNLPITSNYLQQAVNIYPQKRIEIYSDPQLSAQLEANDEQFYDQHDEEYYNFIYDYVDKNIDQFKQ